MFYESIKTYIDENGVKVHDLTGRSIFCLKPKGNGEGIWRQDYLDLEAYIRVMIDDFTSFKIPYALFNDELSDAAFRTTRENIEITSMAEILGLPASMFEPMDVITTKNRLFGASALLFPDIFKEYCERKGVQKIYIIPSSIHELIVIPQDGFTPTDLTHMILSVNATELEESDVLSNHPYFYDLATNEITF